jgi:hypothetical protein
MDPHQAVKMLWPRERYVLRLSRVYGFYLLWCAPFFPVAVYSVRLKSENSESGHGACYWNEYSTSLPFSSTNIERIVVSGENAAYTLNEGFIQLRILGCILLICWGYNADKDNQKLLQKLAVTPECWVLENFNVCWIFFRLEKEVKNASVHTFCFGTFSHKRTSVLSGTLFLIYTYKSLPWLLSRHHKEPLVSTPLHPLCYPTAVWLSCSPTACLDLSYWYSFVS